MSKIEDFIIVNNELQKYIGKDEEVSIPEGVDKIDMQAFSFSNIKKVVLPKSLKMLDFEGLRCASIQEVQILGNTKFPYGLRAFECCHALSKFVVSEDHPTYSIIDDCLCDKEGKTIILVPKAKKSLVIPEGIERIGSFACWSSKVEEVKFSKSVKLIEEEAFRECNQLRELTVPGNVKKIGRLAISSKALEKVVIEDGVETLEYGAIFGIMRKIVLPSSIKALDASAVEGNSKAFFIDMSKVGVGAKIHQTAFIGGHFVHICMPKSLQYEPRYATVIYSDSKLQNLTYNDISTISDFPFDILPTKELKKIAIKEYVHNIFRKYSVDKKIKEESDAYLAVNYKDWLNDAIADVELLTYFTSKNILPKEEIEIMLQKNITEEIKAVLLDYIGSKDCKLLKKAKKDVNVFPNKLTAIGFEAYYSNQDTINLCLPDTVVSVGTSAFAFNKNLKSITLSTLLKFIGTDAFRGCEKLEDIKFNGTIEEWNLVYKGENWNLDVPAKKVVCINGESALIQPKKPEKQKLELTTDNCCYYN